ncbi:carboxylesterase family protein [Shewanella sp. UCD-KL21]|uniref:carboxylesterase family protein n=1 Tax=Shewanella sp. UCD-KL21 TaxID=1917164 RepID=UPI000970D89C|nr:carboxylesterase family protein [Shewanella sp. UCD-KL21]
MTVFYRSTLAILISLSLVACGSDDTPKVTDPEPEIPEVEPLPPQQIDQIIGDSTVMGLKESVVINDLEGTATRVELEAFKGITYATSARFEHSVVTELTDVVDATVFGDACPQLDLTVQDQSEDCLNLNIWRPEDTVESADLPVYVFIHGGDFEFGSGSDPLVQGDNVVAQGALDDKPFIAVTLNYRLGILGSYWLDGSKNDKGGNFALGDQKRALEWVNNNIELFGGNPDKVTLVGQGAGAMSVGILQQTENSESFAGDYFQRAIMQSNPYGFDYKSYDQAKTFQGKLQNYGDDLFGEESSVVLDELTLEQIMQVQERALNPLAKIGAWSGLDCVDVDNLVGSGLCLTSKLSAETTPLANLKPFSPYVDFRARGGIFTPEISGYHLKAQPALTELNVPTVLGFNSNDSRTTAFLPSLTSLIPTIINLIQQLNDAPEDPDLAAVDIQAWLESQDNLALLEQELMAITNSDVEAQVELGDILPSTAYDAITRFFFGLGNGAIIDELFKLTDFYPNDESELTGATGNMAQFNLLVNDMLFSGPARVMAKQTSDNGVVPVTFYNFDYKPSFNVWTTSNAATSIDLAALIKSISCIGNICNGAELPFVFNKPYTVTGNKVTPSGSDVMLMDKLSRLWFSDELFDDYQFNTSDDNVLVIDTDTNIQLEANWDQRKQAGIDPELREGRLTGLEELGLIFAYFND